MSIFHGRIRNKIPYICLFLLLFVFLQINLEIYHQHGFNKAVSVEMLIMNSISVATPPGILIHFELSIEYY